MIQMRLPGPGPAGPDLRPDPDAAPEALARALMAERTSLERRRSEQWLARDLVESIAVRVAELGRELAAAPPARHPVLRRNLDTLRDEQRRHSDRYAALCESWPAFRSRQELRIAELEDRLQHAG
ncbi:hypothetical protein [Poseidonocella sp. HB161398]|uniref:hypothetical protein n=1 Tax=Poseidonocella sp. HB161398 TaxID=2320855 RepID=UPI001107F753|nr:hypothetical protein [Poseidonocella sp. HB161398]